MSKVTPFVKQPAPFWEREVDSRHPTTIHGYDLEIPANGPLRVKVDAENHEGDRREVEIIVPTGGKSR